MAERLGSPREAFLGEWLIERFGELYFDQKMMKPDQVRARRDEWRHLESFSITIGWPWDGELVTLSVPSREYESAQSDSELLRIRPHNEAFGGDELVVTPSGLQVDNREQLPLSDVRDILAAVLPIINDYRLTTPVRPR
jgi:hypothetical protein